MESNNYSLFIGVMVLTILLTNFGLFVAPVFSSETVEQQRALCISKCNSPTGSEMYFGGGGGPDNLMQLRAICISNCENRFWKEWQQEMDKIGND